MIINLLLGPSGCYDPFSDLEDQGPTAWLWFPLEGSFCLMGSGEQQPGGLSAARITVRQGLRRGDAPRPVPLSSEVRPQRHQSSGEGEVAGGGHRPPLREEMALT